MRTTCTTENKTEITENEEKKIQIDNDSDRYMKNERDGENGRRNVR